MNLVELADVDDQLADVMRCLAMPAFTLATESAALFIWPWYGQAFSSGSTPLWTVTYIHTIPSAHESLGHRHAQALRRV
jgi:hypothetical protein